MKRKLFLLGVCALTTLAATPLNSNAVISKKENATISRWISTKGPKDAQEGTFLRFELKNGAKMYSETVDAIVWAQGINNTAHFDYESYASAYKTSEMRVGAVQGTFTLGSETIYSWGTGFLVGPNLVLTAAHILLDEDYVKDNKFMPAEKVAFYPGLTDGTSNDNYIEAKAYHLFPNYVDHREFDWAIIELDSTWAGDNFGYFNLASTKPEIDDKFKTYGYHAYVTSDGEVKGILQKQYQYTGTCSSVYDDNKYAYYDIYGEDGHSGAPMINMSDNFVYGVSTRRISVKTYFEWNILKGFGQHYYEYSEAVFISDYILKYAKQYNIVKNIKVTDYGFGETYPNSAVENTVRTQSGLSFKTNRFRTSVHDGFVVMSCIAKNKPYIDRAYIEYYFDRPVYKFTAKIANWRERDYESIDPNSSIFEIQTPNDKTYDGWGTEVDMYNGQFNYVDSFRWNPTEYTIEFSKPTNRFRFYLLTSYQITSNVNRGRMVIGDMTVYFK